MRRVLHAVNSRNAPVGRIRWRGTLAEFVKLSASVGSAMGADVIRTFYTGSVESFKSFKEVVS
jgi:DhnA family fructose-bisphosphate aldolase class Ia